MNRGMMIVISGPSGAGKGTIIPKIIADGGFALSVSVTTRPPRPNEVDGKDYFFLTEQEFFARRDSGGLLEYTNFGGYYYGTPKSYVEETIAAGMTVLLEIEVDGALQVKEKFKESILIFISPPDKKELEIRLIQRGTQSAESIRERLKIADTEISNIDKYDYLVINDTVENAVHKIKSIVTAERLKPFRNFDTILKLK